LKSKKRRAKILLMKSKKSCLTLIITALLLLAPQTEWRGAGAEPQNINSILFGRNVVFGNEWLSHVIGRHLTTQQFVEWRNKLDRIYDCYADLTGQYPSGRIYIRLSPAEHFGAGNHSAHAHRYVVCYNAGYTHLPRMLENIAAHNSWDRTAMHEIAHIFASGNRWEIEPESIVHLLMSYAMEAYGAEYGSVDQRNIDWVKTAGDQHRKRRFGAAYNNYRKNSIAPFSAKGSGSAFDFYLLGLVDKVGWNAYRYAFRSYIGEPSRSGSKAANAGDLFNRLAYFGDRDALRRLPDNGLLFDRYFGQ
jgi:hypothetical protein